MLKRDEKKAFKVVSPNFRKPSVFRWTPERSQAAVMLAEGYTHKQVGDAVGKTDRAIRLWLSEVEFAAEVDRLSLMVGIASRAERLRLVQRVIRQKVKDGNVETEKDILEWLKFVQGETDGVKLDMAALNAAFTQDAAPLAKTGS